MSKSEGSIVVNYDLSGKSDYMGIGLKDFVIFAFSVYVDLSIVRRLVGLPIILKIILFLAILTVIIAFIGSSLSNNGRKLYKTVYRAFINKNGRYVMNYSNKDKRTLRGNIKRFENLVNIVGVNEEYLKTKDEKKSWYVTKEGVLDIFEIEAKDITQIPSERIDEYIKEYADVIGKCGDITNHNLNFPITYYEQIRYLNLKLEKAENPNKRFYLKMKIKELEEEQLNYYTKKYYIFLSGKNETELEIHVDELKRVASMLNVKGISFKEKQNILKIILNPFELGGIYEYKE